MTTAVVPTAPNKRWLNRTIAAATAVEDSLLVILLVTMIGLAGVQIGLRNIWDTGMAWGDPLLRVMVLWVGLLGAMAATRDDNHITIDVLSRFLPQRASIASRLVTDLFTAAVCSLFAYHGARFVLMDKAAGTLAFGMVPAWACELVIPFGFGIIAVRYLLFFWHRVQQLSETPP